MVDTAKLFLSGNSQAVRLPKSFRIDATEVWITRNEATGELTLQPKPRPDELQDFFALLEAEPVASEAFLPPRDDTPAADPLAGWNDGPLAGTVR
jgi:antitoxin VapB